MQASFNKITTSLIDIFIILSLSLTPLLWFPQGYMVTGSDAGYPIDIIGYFKNRLFTWNSVLPFGNEVSHTMGALTVHGIETFFRYVGFSLYDAQKLNFVFWFMAMGLAMYYFAYSLRRAIPYRYFPLIASIFYIFNFYLLALWRLGAGTTFSAYTALPLVASFFIRALRNEYSPLKSGVMISLVLFIFNAGGGFSVPLFGGLLVTIFTALFYFSFIQFKEEGLKTIIRSLILVFVFLISSVFLNAYWVLPFINYVLGNFSEAVNSHGGVAGFKRWTDVVSEFTSITNLFRLQGFPDWYANIQHAYSQNFLTNAILITVSFIFAPLSYLSLWLPKSKDQKRLILFFVILSLVALFFSAGTHPPTGWLFGFFMDVIPGFVIFRSAQYKFVPALYFSFAILISYTISFLLENVNFSKFKLIQNNNLKKTLTAAILIIVLLLYHFPFFGRNFFVWNKPLTLLLKIPEYVFSYIDWSKANLDDEHRLLVLPRLNSLWKAEVYNWEYFSVYSLFNLLNPKPFVENTPELGAVQYALTNRLYDEILNNGPLIYNISSILQVPNWLFRGDSYYDLFWVPSENPQIFKNALDHNEKLFSIWKSGPWEIYNLRDYKDDRKIYGLKSLTEFVGDEKDVVATLLNKSNNFIQTDPDNKNPAFDKILPFLPINNRIYSSVCSSCILEQNVALPEVLPVRILPGSFLYFLKERREESLTKISDKKQLMINSLGLSLTRTTEIKNMFELKRKTDLIVPIIEKLYDYWKNIDDYLIATESEGTDFSLTKTIKSYADYEKSELQKKYNQQLLVNNEDIINNLAPVLDTINEVIKNIDEKIQKQNWATVKVYKIPDGIKGEAEIFLDKLALNSKNDNSNQLPTTIKLNGKQITLKTATDGEKVSLGKFDFQNNKNIELAFGESENLLTDLRIGEGSYPKTHSQCLIGKVNNFSWQKKYKINLSFIRPAPKDTELYMRIEKNSTKKTDLDKTKNKFSKPDYLFSLNDTRLNPSQFFIFEGQDGNIGATVYLCSSEENPSLSVNNIKVESLFSPNLYFVGDQRSQENPTPQEIKYERINQTKYKVELPENFSPSVLVFNEQFNKGWKLYNDLDARDSDSHLNFTKTWFKTPVFDDRHFKIYGFANAWYIDKSIGERLVMEFYPQQIFYKGLIISGISLILTISFYLLYKLKKSRHRQT